MREVLRMTIATCEDLAELVGLVGRGELKDFDELCLHVTGVVAQNDAFRSSVAQVLGLRDLIPGRWWADERFHVIAERGAEEHEPPFTAPVPKPVEIVVEANV